MIGIIFGGESLEHEVSIASAKALADAFPAKMIYIDTDGNWKVDGEHVDEILPHLRSCGVVFPLIHGEYGENGVLQGFLEMNKIPFVGCDVLSSAICMDKDISKRVLMSHDIKVTPFTTYFSLEEALLQNHEYPFVLKPSSMGSSFGVEKVDDDADSAFKRAFSLCEKVIKEEYIDGREYWVSVLQDGKDLIVSSPCEILTSGDIFTYENKYTEGGASYQLPAKDVNAPILQEIALKAFKVLGCSGMARVDLFEAKDGTIFVNELNTLPGFKPASLFAKSLIRDGITYESIVQSLIRSAIKPKGFKDSSCNLSFSEEGVTV